MKKNLTKIIVVIIILALIGTAIAYQVSLKNGDSSSLRNVPSTPSGTNASE